jgi:hypothetical protein
MEFVQLMAGNAKRRKVSRPAASASPISHSMRRRLATILIAVSALTLPVASAHAADPLLSGYAGPGGGEQVVLGSTTLKKTDKGSSASTSGQDAAADASLKADTSSASTASSPSSGESNGASSTLTRKPQRKKSSSPTSKDRGDDANTTTSGSSTTTTTTPAALPGAPEVVAYPTRAGEVSGLPISAPGILLVVIGVAAATLLGLGLRRFSGSDDPQDPQVSAG